jgi:uncharacterized protein YegL
MGSPESKPEKTENKEISPTVSLEIYSEINECFAKTIVTQKFINSSNIPLELQIYILKQKRVIFSSFNCKIGDSIIVKSKVIKKEKSEEKYEDAISSGNAAIFVRYLPDDENKIIINMGNIPPNNEVIFSSEFIYPTEFYKKYEFEFFRNLPIFMGKNYDIFQNLELNGTINIKTKSKIINVEKDILMKNLNIISENYEKDNNYVIKYQILKLPSFSWYNFEYIESSKIYFDLDNTHQKLLVQESPSPFDPNLKYYFLQYNLTEENPIKKIELLSPCIFIFLIDQSGSMSGNKIKIASQALILFLQSLPVGSYYQIIGFGSNYKLYDELPKEYNKNNINKSIKIIESLEANFGGTDIFSPLKHIYDSFQDYNKINLPKNIFLLTDGEVNDKDRTLQLIEEYSLIFRIYSIGIGNDFDENLIKNAGILGKGNYNFCKNLNNLNSIIASEINKCCTSFITDLEINCNLDKNNLINNVIPKSIRENEIINLYYILKKEDNKDEKVKLKIRYKDNEQNKIIEKKVEMNSEKIEKGEDLSKLIIYNYIITNNNLSNDKKIELALKYQLFTKETSLFAEVELTNKISEQMKLKILGTKEANAINNINEKDLDAKLNKLFKDNLDVNCCLMDDAIAPEGGEDVALFENLLKQYNMAEGNKCKEKKDKLKEKNEDIPIKVKKEEIKELDLNNKEHIMKMINTQDFIEGYWEENAYTKIIKQKYKKEYNLIKRLKNKNIDDNIALTILIIYFINKEHSELLNDLLMIIKKAKIFIEKKTKDKYENIIKKSGIN